MSFWFIICFKRGLEVTVNLYQKNKKKFAFKESGQKLYITMGKKGANWVFSKDAFF